MGAVGDPCHTFSHQKWTDILKRLYRESDFATTMIMIVNIFLNLKRCYLIFGNFLSSSGGKKDEVK